ncbi:hypothetical protein AB204_17775 [Xenorhabdus khoisanae]|uniref:DUF7823 domain-containing protein n=1 Tax=Xenorhabdus khoisanae TaxID=880157 RepID=A0A0J5FP97_9GAMM|nr:hypothetical protein [Xenorhabdus khoisanae]KMJ43782.1 hypothetical protein AB204_17775 [Xenorhabdus khoisanae]
MFEINNPDIVTADTENMLVIDIILGMERVGLPDSDMPTVVRWGYQSEEGASENWPSYGSLIAIENNTPIDIGKTESLFWTEIPKLNGVDSFIQWNVSSYANKESYQRMRDLFKNKVLYITVDGITYNFGKYSNIIVGGNIPPSYTIGYNYFGQTTPDAEKLGNILKQRGVTKRLYFNWCDE